MSKLALLFVNQHYAPDVASTGQHLADLAEHLARGGWRVTVLCGRGGYRGGELPAPDRESRNGVQVRRVGVPGYGRRRLSGRAADYAAFHVRAGLHAAVAREKPDLVVSLTTPSLLPATVRAACGLRRVPYGVWAMDLHPDVEERLGLLPGGRAAAAPLHAASRFGYRGARFVVTLGPHMAREVRRKGVPEGRVHRLPVWNRGSVIRPLASRGNGLRRRLGYGDSDFVVLYSGNAGYAHRFDVVLEAADRLRDHADVHFLFVGGGPRRPEIEREAARRRLPRFRYLDYVPRDELARSLSVGDVHLLTLRADMAGLVAPGKLYGSMAAGRPVLMVGPRASDPGEVIEEERVGVVVDPAEEPGDPAARLAAAILALRDDPGRRRALGERARRVFEEKYDRDIVCARWEALLRSELGKAAGVEEADCHGSTHRLGSGRSSKYSSLAAEE